MRRDGLHFLIPDPAGTIDVVDLRRNHDLPTSLVLSAHDHAVQSWSEDYDGFCGASGPVGTSIDDEAGPFVLRLSGTPSTLRLWEMPLFALHWILARGARPVGREAARTVVWILGALDHRTGTPLSEVAPTLVDADPMALVEVALPRLREESEVGRAIIGLIASGDGAKEAVARLAAALPENRHRFAVVERFSEIMAVLDEPTLPVVVGCTTPTLWQSPETPPPTPYPPLASPHRRPMRALAAGIALSILAGAGIWAYEHRTDTSAPSPRQSAAGMVATRSDATEPEVTSSTSKASTPKEAELAPPLEPETPPPPPPGSQRTVTLSSDGDVTTASPSTGPAPDAADTGGDVPPRPAGAKPSEVVLPPVVPTTNDASAIIEERPPEKPEVPGLAQPSLTAEPLPPTQTVTPPPAASSPPAGGKSTGAITALEPSMPLPPARPTVVAVRPETVGRTTHPAAANGEIRIYRLGASAGSSCLSVFLGETRAVREELPFTTFGRFATTRHAGTLCGFEVALGHGLVMAIDPTFLAATRERAGTEPNTRRFLLTESRRGRSLPHRSTIEVGGGGRATRTYELTIDE